VRLRQELDVLLIFLAGSRKKAFDEEAFGDQAIADPAVVFFFNREVCCYDKALQQGIVADAGVVGGDLSQGQLPQPGIHPGLRQAPFQAVLVRYPYTAGPACAKGRNPFRHPAARKIRAAKDKVYCAPRRPHQRKPATDL
jgi:hypothetical protein